MNYTIEREELFEMLEKKQQCMLIDVRDQAQFEAWHMPDSINIPNEILNSSITSLPKNKKIITICNRGHASHYAAELLRQYGFDAVSLDHGMKGWNSIYDIVSIPATKKIRVYQIKRLGKGCLGYIVSHDNNAIVIDPTVHINPIIKFLQEIHLKLLAVIDTHVHADHISGGLSLSKHYSAPYLLPKKSVVDFEFTTLEDFVAKLPIAITVIETPGHTEESACLLIDGHYLLTGDTLFLDSVGRTDLGEKVNENSALLYESVTGKIANLDESVFVLPAHTQKPMRPGEGAVFAKLSQVKKDTAIFSIPLSETFVATMVAANRPTPSNFLEIKKINRIGVIPQGGIDELELGGNRCAI